jgi:hypothetical protein
MPELMMEEPAPTGQPAGPHPSGLPVGMEPGSFDDVDENYVSPEEQAQYDQFVTKALKLIHTKGSQRALLQQLNQPKMKVYEAVGRAAAMMAMTIAEQAEASGAKLSPDVVFHGTADYIVPELFEVGQAAKIIPMEDEQNQINMAFLEAQRVYGEELLNSPDGPKLQQEAQDYYSHQVAREMDEGGDPDQFREGILGVAREDPLASAISSELANRKAANGA